VARFWSGSGGAGCGARDEERCQPEGWRYRGHGENGRRQACLPAGRLRPYHCKRKRWRPEGFRYKCGPAGLGTRGEERCQPEGWRYRATAKTGGAGRKSRTALRHGGPLALKAKGAAPDTTPIGRLALPGDGPLDFARDYAARSGRGMRGKERCQPEGWRYKGQGENGRRQACLPVGGLRPYRGKRKRWRPPTSVGTGSGWRYMVLGRRRQSGDWPSFASTAAGRRSQGDAVVALRTSMKSAQPGVAVLRKATSESEGRTAPPVAAQRMGDSPLSPYGPGVTIGGNAPENCDLDAPIHRFPRMEHFSKSLPVSLTPLINLTVLIRNTSRA
jgi:hypothetical protein